MKERIKEMKKRMFRKEAITGWVIFALFLVYIGLSIQPARENPREFFRIMVMVLGGGIGSGVIMMWFFERFLPGDEKKDEKRKS